jgi:hypothetical protein
MSDSLQLIVKNVKSTPQTRDNKRTPEMGPSLPALSYSSELGENGELSAA